MEISAELSTGELRDFVREQTHIPAPSISRLIPVGDFFVDTTVASPLHKIARYDASNTFLTIKAYVLAVVLTYLPLALAAFFGPLPIAAQTAGVKLPFLYDWNIAFAFLVTFPCVVIFTMSDQAALAAALFRIQCDGILVVQHDAALALSTKWNRRFRSVNRGALIAGASLGTLLVIVNSIAYSRPNVGFWVSITRNPRSLMVAAVFLYCIFILYGSALFYICRCVAITLFLNDVVTHSELEMVPLHPDRCGGLRPIGRFGLRNQYLLSILGMNVVFLIVVTGRYLNVNAQLFGLVAGAAGAYGVLGPIVFMGPLLSFRAAMSRTKTVLLSEVAQRLRVELQRLRKQLHSGRLLEEDDALIDRLRKVGEVIDELPIWPFDAETLRTFITAYVFPLIAFAFSAPAVRGAFARALVWIADQIK